MYRISSSDAVLYEVIGSYAHHRLVQDRVMPPACEVSCERPQLFIIISMLLSKPPVLHSTLRSSTVLYRPPFLRTLHTSPRFLATPIVQQSPQPQPQPKPQPTPAGIRPTGRGDTLSIWPFVIILGVGTGLFALIVRSREGTFTPKGTVPSNGEYTLKKGRNSSSVISH